MEAGDPPAQRAGAPLTMAAEEYVPAVESFCTAAGELNRPVNPVADWLLTYSVASSPKDDG